MYRILFIILAVCYLPLSLADQFTTGASYQVCFTPGEACTDLITATINKAKAEILVQAYSFTSAPIAKALINAQKRGVSVKILLDKSQFRSRGYSSAKFFSDYKIPLLMDSKPSIAHNKVIIIDNKIVITGSFNFTRAAQERNAENVLIITDEQLAKRYKDNWKRRELVSVDPTLQLPEY